MKYTYSSSGVNVDLNDEFTDYIKKIVKVPEWVLKEPTGYATILTFTNPPIVVTADGVGSKMLLHIKHKIWNDAAKDLIAMNFNDILAVGGRPLAFVDYLGIRGISSQHFEFIKALNDELEALGMSLVAGETAEIPSIYTETEWDVAGFCIGILENKMTPEEIKVGDKIVGFKASGFHSNGWSLIRKILESEKIEISSLDFDLLVGTKIYSELVPHLSKFKGLAHVTGGGLNRALNRLLKGKGASIQIQIPKYIEWILKYVDLEECLKTFNLGYGMIGVLKSDSENLFQGLDFDIIGTVTEKEFEFNIS